MLRPGHFARADFAQDFLKPFTERFRQRLSTRSCQIAHIFVEAEPFAPPPQLRSVRTSWFYAPHFYDAVTLFDPPLSPPVSISISLTACDPSWAKAQYQKAISAGSIGRFSSQYADDKRWAPCQSWWASSAFPST